MAFAWKHIRANNRKPAEDGAAPVSDEAGFAELSRMAETFLKGHLPILRKLGAV